MKKNYKAIALIVCAAFVLMISGRLEASLAPATLPGQQAVRSQDLQKVQTFLEQKEVVQHLAKMNLSKTDIESRLGNLSDADLHNVAMRIDQQRAGGDSAVGILVIVVLVLLVIYLVKRV